MGRTNLAKKGGALCMEHKSNYAVKRDAQMESLEGVCAPDMEQSGNYASMKDAQITLRLEECALSMGQRSNNAAQKDTQIKSTKEECALGMGRRNYAAWKVAQAMQRKEVCAQGTVVQRRNDALTRGAQILLKKVCIRHGAKSKSSAELKGAQIKLSKEDCAQGTGHTAMHTTNHLLHLDQNTRRLPQRKHNLERDCRTANRGHEEISVPGEVTIICQEIVVV